MPVTRTVAPLHDLCARSALVTGGASAMVGR